jgi:predicted dehydrogenase
MSLKVAIAGSGYFSQVHYDAWSRLEGVALVGAASLDRPSLDLLAGGHGVAARFDDVAAMLDASRPDLLDIVVPPSGHEELLELAAARGVHVICQKPLGGDLATARRLVERAADAGITFAVHENFRFQPWYREARRLLDAGRLGEVTNIAFRLRPGDGQGAGAYLDRQPYFQKMKQFLVHETAIHLIDSFLYLMGEITAVYASLRRLNPVISGEDAGILLFDFASGASGLFDGNRLIDFPARNPRLTMGECWIEGTEGRLRLDGDGDLWLRPQKGEEARHPYDWDDRGFGGDCVLALQRHVVAHLLDGAPLENAESDYLRNLEIEDAIYRSAASGQRIPLDG